MKTKILISLCYALSICIEVSAENEQEVKRGLFPYMAFIYYPDETVVDGSGGRFLRGAVLIQPNWLISSAIGPNTAANELTGFPRKTLLARVGATSIDANFTLNEDEDEQEREIIQIVRPYNHSATQWWHTDISLMKTLLPFNMTLIVSSTSLVNKLDTTEKTEKECTILVYAKKNGNWTENRYLMKRTVELLPSSVTNCGHHFVGKTMICATSEENQNSRFEPNFCQGNGGGPLVCDSDVIGLQTYIDNNCKQPHLYQLLTAWQNFISCGTEEKCNEEQCSNICDVSNKDPPEKMFATMITKDISILETTTVNESIYNSSTVSDPVTVESYNHSVTPTVTSQELTTIKLVSFDQPTMTDGPILDETSKEYSTSIKETTLRWPNEKYPNAGKTIDSDDAVNTNRKPEVEAQQQDLKKKVKARSSGQYWVLNHRLFFAYLILAYVV